MIFVSCLKVIKLPAEFPEVSVEIIIGEYLLLDRGTN